jgi:hypothetical protein
MVAEQLSTQDPALLKAAVDILSRHTDWADDLSEKISAWLAVADPAPDELAMTRGAVAALLARPAVERAVAGALVDGKTSRPTRLMLLEVIAESDAQRAAGAVWLDGLRASLRDSDPDVLRQAIAAVANGGVAIGTALIVPGDEALVERIREASETFGGEVGISAWNGFAMARFCAQDAARLRADMMAVLGRASGVALPADVEEGILGFTHSLPGFMKPSFLLDLESGGPTELDDLSGAVSRLGRLAGVETPVHDVATAALGLSR